MTVQLDRGIPFAGFPLAGELDADHPDRVPCNLLVRVTEHLVHAHHITLLYGLHA